MSHSRLNDMCAEGLDQTKRFSQEWHILAPLLEQKYNLTSDCGGQQFHSKSLTFFSNGCHAWNAFHKLAARPSTGSDIETLLPRLAHSNRTSRATLLETLPFELTTMILSDAALELQDVTALGLCSKTLWWNCLSYVKATMSKAPWANTPLLCTGTYLTDVPPVIRELVPSVKQHEHDYQARRSRKIRRRCNGGPMCPARRWNWDAIGSYADASMGIVQRWLVAFDAKAQNHTTGITAADKEVLRASLEQVVSAGEPETDSRWILRNRTIQQYASLKCAFGGSEPQLHVKGFPWLTLDKALLFRIGWTSPANFAEDASEVELSRGIWAGHRFDVVRAENFAVGTEGWEDVTDGMVREAEAWRGMEAALSDEGPAFRPRKAGFRVDLAFLARRGIGALKPLLHFFGEARAAGSKL